MQGTHFLLAFNGTELFRIRALIYSDEENCCVSAHLHLCFRQRFDLLNLIRKISPCFPLNFLGTVGGATVGTISGAIKGQTTETGLFRGAGVGAVAGAITAVQLLELMVNGEPFSKVALICSLVNGKIFMEWVSPAVLKAYQWQISDMESNLREISDIFEVNSIRGLSREAINDLPTCNLHSIETTNPSCHETICAICLTDFKNGDCARMLPTCGHSFHLNCIDEWLNRNGTCPVCRRDI
ncbi:NEP1-interacting protein-like 1 isoform X1 [Coffea arabica]|uniref:NEP1-interacting protein-like 1 isoform X1 n=1 Tax=Coffea arabica TaxID=13443 RepID=A0ABM4UJS6_COFAR